MRYGKYVSGFSWFESLDFLESGDKLRDDFEDRVYDDDSDEV